MQGTLDLLPINSIFLQFKMGNKWAGCRGFSSPLSIKWELQEHHQAQASKKEPGLLEEEIMTIKLILKNLSLPSLLCLNQPIHDRAPSQGYTQVHRGRSILTSPGGTEQNEAESRASFSQERAGPCLNIQQSISCWVCETGKGWVSL